MITATRIAAGFSVQRGLHSSLNFWPMASLLRTNLIFVNGRRLSVINRHILVASRMAVVTSTYLASAASELVLGQIPGLACQLDDPRDRFSNWTAGERSSSPHARIESRASALVAWMLITCLS